MARSTTGINRRAALGRIGTTGLGLAASITWVESLSALAQSHASHVERAAQSAVAWKAKILNPHQLETVATLSDLIIPATETPGARAVFVHRFVDGVLEDATTAERTRFTTALQWLDTRSTALFKKRFVDATPAEQTDLLTRISTTTGGENSVGTDFFTAIKSMTITGYYTTEIGLQKELGDDGVLAQASFEGCTHPEHKMQGV